MNDAAERGHCALGIWEVCEKTQEQLFVEVRSVWVVALGIVLLVLLTTHLLHRCRVQALPESFVTVVLGAVLGLLLWASPSMGSEYHLNAGAVKLCFTWMLNLVALPVIIFESGWSLRIRDFASQFAYIMLFAIVGTVLSVLVVACLTVWTSAWHSVGTWRAALAYASLISSVDPVSTLATFGKLNVDPLLFILVFGESQINDAVAITLFKALNEHPLAQPWALVWRMCWVLFGSIALGCLTAMAYILVLRCTRMGQSPAQAILLIFMSCFFTFSTAEWLTLSGIITVLFNSIVMGAYTGAHLTTEGMALTSFLLKQMSSLADTLIFMSCGVMAVFVVRKRGSGTTFGLSQALFCLIGRFVAIVPLGLLSNGIKTVVGRRLPKEKQHMLTWKHLFMMWHSGLRGGVSLVLVMELGDWVDKDVADMKDKMVNGTFLLVVSYLLVFGSTTGLFLRLLGLPLGDQVPEGQELYGPEDKKGYGWRCLVYTRKKVMLPLLVGTATGRKVYESEGVLADVIREAEAAERRPDFGTSVPHRHSSVRGVNRRSSMLFLFGSVDPAHVDAFEDIAEDMGRASPETSSVRGRLSSGCPLDSCGEASRWEEEGSSDPEGDEEEDEEEASADAEASAAGRGGARGAGSRKAP